MTTRVGEDPMVELLTVGDDDGRRARDSVKEGAAGRVEPRADERTLANS
jgi:hypothetical protein